MISASALSTGTGMGGLLALLLGRLRVPIDQVTNIIEALSKSLFDVPFVSKQQTLASRISRQCVLRYGFREELRLRKVASEYGASTDGPSI